MRMHDHISSQAREMCELCSCWYINVALAVVAAVVVVVIVIDSFGAIISLVK